MVKKVRELTFSLMVIFVIAIGIYWLMVELQKDYLNYYVTLLGDKLIELVPESSEKRTLMALFDNFKEQVENQDVTPEQVEKVAAGILNISNLKDSISVEEAKAVLELAELYPKSDANNRTARVGVRSATRNNRDSELRWRELGERLESIYKLDQTMKTVPDSVKFIYRFDDRLNIIIDTHVKLAMDQKKHGKMITEIRQLEKEKAVIWQENVTRQIENTRITLKLLQEKDNLAEIRDLDKIILFDPEFSIDSLSKIRIDIDIDSLNVVIDKELEKHHIKER